MSFKLTHNVWCWWRFLNLFLLVCQRQSMNFVCLSIELCWLIIEIWRLSVRNSFIFSVVSAAVSLFLPSGILTQEVTRQDRLEYCFRRSTRSTSLANSSPVRFDKSSSLCHSWTSCSKLFRRFVRFWIFLVLNLNNWH